MRHGGDTGGAAARLPDIAPLASSQVRVEWKSRSRRARRRRRPATPLASHPARGREEFTDLLSLVPKRTQLLVQVRRTRWSATGGGGAAVGPADRRRRSSEPRSLRRGARIEADSRRGSASSGQQVTTRGGGGAVPHARSPRPSGSPRRPALEALRADTPPAWQSFRVVPDFNSERLRPGRRRPDRLANARPSWPTAGR